MVDEWSYFVDGMAKLTHIKWLRDHPIYLQRPISALDFCAQMRRKNDDFSAKTDLPQAPHHFESVQSWHVIISDDQIEWRLLRLHLGQSIFAVARDRKGTGRPIKCEPDGTRD